MTKTATAREMRYALTTGAKRHVFIRNATKHTRSAKFRCCFLTWPNVSVRVDGSESGQGGVGDQILDGASHINTARQVTVVP